MHNRLHKPRSIANGYQYFENGLLLLLALALGSCNALFGAPSDAHLQSVFLHHQKEFAELVAMCEQDRALVRIAPGFTWLATDFSWPRNDIGLSPARWDEYRSLFQQLGIKGGVSRRTDYPAAIFSKYTLSAL
jgi:hypothetical protein